jgi:CheY-like chemotaxis protein
MPADETKKLRILVVEDHWIVAETICDILRDKFEIIGPVPDVRQALTAVTQKEPDGAVLDINLDGKSCFPIADIMYGRGLPFVFLTDYSDPKVVPPAHRGAPFLPKAIGLMVLRETIALHFLSYGRTLH